MLTVTSRGLAVDLPDLLPEVYGTAFAYPH